MVKLWKYKPMRVTYGHVYTAVDSEMRGRLVREVKRDAKSGNTHYGGTAVSTFCLRGTPYCVAGRYGAGFGGFSRTGSIVSNGAIHRSTTCCIVRRINSRAGIRLGVFGRDFR